MALARPIVVLALALSVETACAHSGAVVTARAVGPDEAAIERSAFATAFLAAFPARGRTP